MLKDVYKKLCETLGAAGIEAPGNEARLLIEYATGLKPSLQLAYANDPIPGYQEDQLLLMAEKRAERYPLQYLLGSWSFMGFELKIGEGVLIPRDDTEVLTTLCLEYLKGSNGKRALDLCAGSGAIGIALSKLGGAEVTAVELSEEAFKFLSENIETNHANVEPVRGDVYRNHGFYEDGYFDLIASNPPYIRSDEIKTLQPEVLHEPAMALDGGEDGLEFYRAIIRLWTRTLKKGGALAFELGEDQADEVAALMRGYGYTDIKTAKDLGGTDRAIIGTLSDI